MRKRTSKVWEPTIDQLKSLLEGSECLSDVLRALGLEPKGGNLNTLKRRLKAEGIHPQFKIPSNKLPRGGSSKIPLEHILVENSNYSRAPLKKRLLEEGLLENRCQICGLDPQWEGKKLVLIIDHINGISNDNRLENLRMLCPNCNSQVPTFAGKNTKTQKIINCCPKCGKEICKGSTYCQKCSIEERQREKDQEKGRDLESEAILKQLLDGGLSYEAVGKELGITGSAVKKRAKRLGLESKFSHSVKLKIDEVRDLIEKGLTSNEIAERLSSTKNSIKGFCRKNGLELNGVNGLEVSKWKVYALLDSGMHYKEVAKKFGLSPSTVKVYIHKRRRFLES